MSRLSTHQVIQNGDYLNPEFDPSTLTMAHLLGIFQYHSISYPSQHNKAKLVEVFNENVKGNAKKLRKQRLVRQETPASIDGILDGVTGKQIAPAAPSEPSEPVCSLHFVKYLISLLTFDAHVAAPTSSVVSPSVSRARVR